VLGTTVWRRVLGVDRATVIERVEVDERENAVVAHVRPRRDSKRRCGRCGQVAPLYDRGEGRRRWRAIDLGAVRCLLESDAPRVDCPTHGPTVAQVPWARHGAGHTRDLDDLAARLVTHAPRSAVSELLRIAWRTVGSIIDRVVADGRAAHDPFDGLRRIGIDEISYKRGHRYLMIVVDHDTGRLVWAGIGRDKKTLEGFFDLLGKERCAKIRLVSADAAEWIADLVRDRCKRATLCTDGFHVVAWATEALDEVRREVWNAARRQGMRGFARELKGALRLVEEPRGPHGAPGGKARLDLCRQPQVVPGVPARGAAPRGHPPQGAAGHRHDPHLAGLGGKEQDRRLRRARATDPQEPPRDRGGHAPQALQRADRVHQHEDPGPAPDGLRVQEARASGRPRAPRPRRLLPTPTRTERRLMDPRMRQESRRNLHDRMLDAADAIADEAERRYAEAINQPAERLPGARVGLPGRHDRAADPEAAHRQLLPLLAARAAPPGRAGARAGRGRALRARRLHPGSTG